MASPTTSPGPVSASASPIGPIVYFYADHEHARGMKSMDDSEPFVAIVASPPNVGSGFSVPVTSVTPIVEPTAPALPPAATSATASPAPSPAPVVTGGGVTGVGEIVGGQSYRNGVYKNVPLVGGSGKGAKATITVTGNGVTAVVPDPNAPGTGYVVGDELSAAIVDRLVNVLVIDHAAHTFALQGVPMFHGDDGDDKAALSHCEATYRKVEKPEPASADARAAAGAAASGTVATPAAAAAPKPFTPVMATPPAQATATPAAAT